MKYAIISDLHANVTALQNVLADAKIQGVERIICLGDVVGYGPMPKATLTMVQQTTAITLAGNHDDAVSGRQSADDFINLAGEAVDRHRDELSNADLAWLRSLPYTCEFEGAIAAHGDLTDPAKFYYIESEDDAAANFAVNDAQLMFVGHTHVPAIFLTGQSGNVYRLDAQDFTIESGKRYIVNPGSVGYPREADGKCFSSYVLYDSTSGSVFFRKLPFSVASVMQRGVNPRRRKSAIALAAVASVVAAALGIFIALRPTKIKTEAKIIEVTAQDDRPLALREKSITLSPSTHFVRANLKLAKGSDAVELKIVFKDASGKVCGDQLTKTVKSSSRDRFKVPENTVTAHFTVVKTSASSQPRIAEFAPDLK